MSDLLTEDSGRIRTLTLNRPEKRNALNDALIASLKDALRKADEADEISALVIRGAGKDFCSGADLSALQKIASSSYEENLEDARSLAEMYAMIRRVKMPVVAAVHGRALAGGCGLATACDLVLAASTARFGYPEVKIGFVPAIVMTYLRRHVSEKIAFELATTGVEFSAEKAAAIGLVNRILPEDTFDQDVRDFVSDYEKVSGSAVRLSKKLLYQMDARTFEDSVELGAKFNAEARMTEDCQNGIRRFLDKSKT